MNTTALFTRKIVLNALGYTQNASRSSWSHDDGQHVFFDAWAHRYTDDGLYPMSTDKHYPRAHDYTRRGLTAWLAHLDLVLAGERQPILINPVPQHPSPDQHRSEGGAKGWLPRFSLGQVLSDDAGQLWFHTTSLHSLDLSKVVDWTDPVFDPPAHAKNGTTWEPGEDSRVLWTLAREVFGDDDTTLKLVRHLEHLKRIQAQAL